MRSAYKGAFLVVGAMLLMGIASLPFGFYQLLRWVVPIGGAILLRSSIKANQPGWAIIGVLAILLWFPLFGVSFEKATWSVLDLVFGVAFIAAGMLSKEK